MAPARVVVPAVATMARPSQLLLVATVMLLGTAFAAAHGASPDPAAMVVGLLALLPVAAGIHLANEYADHETDRLTTRTPFSGGSGALARTGLPRSMALRAAQAATLAGFGAAVAGASLDAAAVAAFVPLTLVVTANLLATTWPDRVADAAVGKRTLATRWQPAGLRRLFATLAASATALIAAGLLAWPAIVVLAGLSAVPLMMVGLAWYTRRESPFPTVAAMVWLVVAQLGAWALVAQG